MSNRKIDSEKTYDRISYEVPFSLNSDPGSTDKTSLN